MYKPFEIWYFNCLRMYVPCVFLKCLSGLTIQCSNINTGIFCVYAYTVCSGLPDTSQLLKFINVCAKLEAITELNVFLLF